MVASRFVTDVVINKCIVIDKYVLIASLFEQPTIFLRNTR